MEEWIDVNYRSVIQEIKKFSPSLQYAACAKFLDLVRPYFYRFTLPIENNLFYRVRTHDEGTGKYFFTNISELFFRSDLFNIKKFGRYNCPYESMFYCSDSALLALIEVSQFYKVETKKDALYHILSIGK